MYVHYIYTYIYPIKIHKDSQLHCQSHIKIPEDNPIPNPISWVVVGFTGFTLGVDLTVLRSTMAGRSQRGECNRGDAD